jgi:hypothetical protein
MSKRPSVLARACASVCLVAIALSSPSTLLGSARLQAQTQDRAEIDRDVQELRQYRLTLEKVKLMASASLAYAQAQSRDPRVQARLNREKELSVLETKSEARLTPAEQQRLEELRKKADADYNEAVRNGEDVEPKTLGDMSRRIEREPDLASAVRTVGLTSREFSMVTLTFFNAIAAHRMKKAGAIKDVPADILPENMAFIQANEAELNQIFAQLQAHDR